MSIRQSEIKHRIGIRNFENWLKTAGKSPADMALKSRLRDIVSKRLCVPTDPEDKKSSVVCLIFGQDTDIDPELLKDDRNLRNTSCCKPYSLLTSLRIPAGRHLRLPV